MASISVGEWVGFTITFFFIIPVVTYLIGGYFRKKVLVAFYVYLMAFIAVIPFLFVPHPLPEELRSFLIIKYFVVNIPYMLLLMTIMGIAPGSNCIQNVSRRLFKQTIVNSNENKAIDGHKTWISWFWWTVFVLNMLVAFTEDISGRSIPNAICAILLCLPFNWPMPINTLSVTLETNGEYYSHMNLDENIFEFRVFGISLLWIIVYTSWDFCLLFGFRGALWTFYTGATHLGVPLVRSIIDNRTDLWFHYRLFALGFTLLFNTIVMQLDWFHLDEIIIYNKDMDEKKYHVFLIWGSINCIGAIINFLIQIIAWNKRKQKLKNVEKTLSQTQKKQVEEERALI